jgi:glycosyltransferase involved in cell wall biosynthesis
MNDHNNMIVYFEIGPLREREYTGLAQVTAALAERLLGDSSVAGRFFFGRMIVPRNVVEILLKTRCGELLEWHLGRLVAQPAPGHVTELSVGIFPNRKTARRAFSKDCQIVHDLSTLLTPQFHDREVVQYHATTLEHDILTNDITFCVSEATRSDVLSYFPSVRPEAVATLPLAAPVPSMNELASEGKEVEPYILVLGTIEPRKNISQVLECIRARPSLTRSYRVVFLGRFGWGMSVEKLIEAHGLQEQYRKGRILFPGFVTEEVKNLLIRNARVLVYPSLFEGFGLPVVEAMALGVPCVTTRSSSLPEAAGPHAYYFDPFVSGDIEKTMMKAIVDVDLNADLVRKRCIEWAQRFSWDATYGAMQRRIAGLFAAPDGSH